ncbi:coiled-coil protein, partial [mine drainage metagenome]
VLLTPKEILTKDEAWINRSDLLDGFQNIYLSMPDDQLRAQVNEYFLRRLSEDAKEDEVREAAASTIEKFPQLLDYYILRKEDTGEEAHKVSGLKVRDTEQQFIHQVRALVDGKLVGTDF